MSERIFGSRIPLGFLTRLKPGISPYLATIALYLGAAIMGSLLAVIAQTAEPDQRLVVGNAGGTLAVLFEVADSRILVGTGASTSHSADLLGRTTRPWNRNIDLLIVPAWDDHHAAGALGLLERQAVDSIAVAGLASDAQVWTLLDRRASQQDTPIRYLAGSHELQVNRSIKLTLAPLSESSEGSWIRMEHHGKRIDVIDADLTTAIRPDPRALGVRNDHVVINMRSQGIPSGTDPKLAITPAPFWPSDFSAARSPYWAGIERDEYVELDLSADAIRIDLDNVETRADQ